MPQSDPQQHSQEPLPEQPVGIPPHYGSTFEELFASGAPFWLKMIGSAIFTTVLAAGSAWKMKNMGELKLPEDPLVIAASVGVVSLIGALLGGYLSIKDVVERRMDTGEPVAFLLKLLFGYGMVSLFFVWFPGIIVLTLIVTLVFLV